VAADTRSTGDAVAALVTAANEALAEVKKHTAAGTPGVGGAAGTGRGALASDSLVRALSGRIIQGVTDALGGVSAASVGIQSTKDGTLVLDRAALDKALAQDPTAVRDLISPAAGGGIAARLSAVVDSATSTSTGFLTSAVQGRERTKKDIETQILSWDRRLELRQAALQRQFSGLEVALGRLQSQSSWLSGQLAGMSRQSS
jgi:flagellar hook-associated protein 2